MLRDKGFRVTGEVAGIPTAVIGGGGQGGPVIATLGEYGALPGLSQKANTARPRPLLPGGAGQGCGHNLLGAARKALLGLAYVRAHRHHAEWQHSGTADARAVAQRHHERGLHTRFRGCLRPGGAAGRRGGKP